LTGHEDTVSKVIFAPTFAQETGLHYLASVDWSGVVFMWNVELIGSD
jgi:hypothetical protein